MVFSSAIFLFAFLPILLLAYYIPFFAGIRYRNTVLLLGSLLFYAWGEPRFVAIMVGEVLFNWIMGPAFVAVRDRWKDFWCIIGVVLDIGILFVYKYASFLDRNLIAWTGAHREAINIALPIGISFFTFQILSYLLDLRRGQVEVQRRPDDLCLYVALFPQLIAGPIVRYSTVSDAILHRKENWHDFSLGVERFIIGLGKKVLIANYVAVIADNLFVMAEDGYSLAALTAWIGAIAYALQIYFDFSGYSDMAIGLGLMFGFRFNENFNYPYVATSVTDFWRRWHISLSTWFRDYVYIPLGGSRCKPWRNLCNLFIVWALTGIWHGANWTFLAWGLFYFLTLLFERTFKLTNAHSVLMRIWTILVILIGWVLFRSSSLGDALHYMGMMLGKAGGFADWSTLSYLLNGGPMMALAIIFSIPVKERFRSIRTAYPLRFKIITQFGLFVVFIASLLASLKAAYNPFIYFNF